MHASLPMYDLPPVRAASDAWWHGLAGYMRAFGIAGVPNRLQRDPVPDWTDEGLLFSQVCGYPLTHGLAGSVEPIIVPSYALPDAAAGRYRSLIVVAADATARDLAELADCVCAVNAADSHSGYNVLRYMVAPYADNGRFFHDVVVTGSHQASLAAVASGRADVCAVDAVTHGLLARHDAAELQGTRVLQASPAAPALPYVAGPAVDADTRRRLRQAVGAAMADPELTAVRRELLIDGFVTPETVDYGEILALERYAVDAGYPALA